MRATKPDEEKITHVTGFAPDTSTHLDDLEAIIDDESSGRRGLSVIGIPATVIGIPAIDASDEDWHRWLDGFLRP